MSDAELLEIEIEREVTREEAADWLRSIADSLARHNELEFDRSGVRFHVEVPDVVIVEIELDVGGDANQLEIELKW